MNLHETQAEFALNLLSAERPPRLAISGPAAPGQLLQLYRNNFIISLTELLEAVFPVCRQLVGEEFFRQLSKAYILATPLQEASLSGYGAGFADFIEQNPRTKPVPYLADVARLEWALEQAKSQTQTTPFPFQRLETLSQEHYPRLCLHPAPGVRLLSSSYPVLSIWEGVTTDRLEGIDLSRGEQLLIVPQAGDTAELVRLSQAQGLLFEGVAARRPLQSLTLPEGFQTLLQHWIATGIIDDFSLTVEES